MERKLSYKRIIIRAYAMIFAMGMGVMLLGGRGDYWQGWVFSGTYFVFVTITLVMFRGKVDLLAERFKPGPGVKWWDRVFFGLYLPLSIAMIGVGSLDGGRFGWTGRLPVAIYAAGYLAMLVSYAGVLWAMWTNKFFSSRVRIQTDRGQYVIGTGPYRFIRHPGYAFGICVLFGISIVLGSLWALIPAGLAAVLLVVRTGLEDRMLRKELPGYGDYAQKVRFRLIPGLW